LSKSYLNLDVTYEYAVNKLAGKEPVEVARNAGAGYDPEIRMFKVIYLGETFTVSFPDGAVNLPGKDQEVPIVTKILILHYLATANGAPLQNKYISFKELPDGAIYIEPFTNRAIRPMLKYFADYQREFVDLTKTLDAREESLGDTSVTVFPFPRVPITYVIWSGDDEFPASGNILFDASAPCYLPTEDYALLSGLIIHHLGKLLAQTY